MVDNSTPINSDFIQALLGDDRFRDIVTRLGIANDSADVQSEVIGQLGILAIKRVIVEAFKRIPVEEHEELESLVGSGDAASFRDILESYIPELDNFIAETMQKEVEATLALASEKE